MIPSTAQCPVHTECCMCAGVRKAEKRVFPAGKMSAPARPVQTRFSSVSITLVNRLRVAGTSAARVASGTVGLMAHHFEHRKRDSPKHGDVSINIRCQSHQHVLPFEWMIGFYRKPGEAILSRVVIKINGLARPIRNSLSHLADRTPASKHTADKHLLRCN